MMPWIEIEVKTRHGRWNELIYAGFYFILDIVFGKAFCPFCPRLILYIVFLTCLMKLSNILVNEIEITTEGLQQNSVKTQVFSTWWNDITRGCPLPRRFKSH